MNEVKTPAVVLGGGISGLAVVRALGRRGVPTILAGAEADLAAHSRWTRPLGAITATALSLHDALDEAGVGDAVLFPASDPWAVALAGQVRTDRPAVVPRKPVVNAVVDKVHFAKVLERLNIPHPRSVQIHLAEELQALHEDDLARYFIKPGDSSRFSEVFGCKGVWAADPSAPALLEQALEMGLDLLLQEYVPSRAEDHVFLDGYVTRDGVVAVLYARRRLRARLPDFGNSTLTEVIPLSDLVAANDALRRLFDATSFTGGLFDAEFVRARDGSFRLLEVNARAWWQLALAAHVGADVCWLAYLDAIAENIKPVEVTPRGQRWVHTQLDAAAWLADVRANRYSPAGAPPRAWRGAVHAVFARDDRGPGQACLAEHWRRLRRVRVPIPLPQRARA